MDDCSEVAVVSRVEVSRIPSGSTKLDGLEGIGAVKQNELSD